MTAKIDPFMPPALFAKPLFRFQLARPEISQLGWLLIDVIAVLPPRPLREQGSKFAFPYYVCLALGSTGAWNEVCISGGDDHCELGEAYRVVSSPAGGFVARGEWSAKVPTNP
jgi:hypothetical protein